MRIIEVKLKCYYSTILTLILKVSIRRRASTVVGIGG